jgi:hypothetical protein
MRKPLDTQVRYGLARRLLHRAVRLVPNTALYGLVIYCVGCVIPTPLDRAPAPTNYSPVFVTSRVNPAFGKISQRVLVPGPFTLAATDPNPDDALDVHLFEPDSTGALVYIGVDWPLMIPTPPDQTDPNLRLYSTTATLCPQGTQGQTFDVYAIVADRPFQGSLPKVQDGGLSDTNHWELSCM